MARFEYAGGRMPVAMVQGEDVYYLAYDQVGSLRAVYTALGAVVRTVEYDAWGNILSEFAAQDYEGLKVPFGFAGGLHDRDTGLVLFGLRNYDPETGRWTSRDPIGLAGGDTDLYAYCGNDPVGKVDPTGLADCGANLKSGAEFTEIYVLRFTTDLVLYPGQPTNEHSPGWGLNLWHWFEVLSDDLIDVGGVGSGDRYWNRGMVLSSGQQGNYAAGYMLQQTVTPPFAYIASFVAEIGTNQPLQDWADKAWEGPGEVEMCPSGWMYYLQFVGSEWAARRDDVCKQFKDSLRMNHEGIRDSLDDMYGSAFASVNSGIDAIIGLIRKLL